MMSESDDDFVCLCWDDFWEEMEVEEYGEEDQGSCSQVSTLGKSGCKCGRNSAMGVAKGEERAQERKQ